MKFEINCCDINKMLKIDGTHDFKISVMKESEIWTGNGIDMLAEWVIGESLKTNHALTSLNLKGKLV